MLKRVRNTKIGDVFAVPISENEKRYMQYIISDMTMLNSDVIRVFKKVYALDANPAIEEIVNDEVDFYAHCVTKAGIKMGLWEKVGNTPDVGQTDHIIFRDSWDYGNPKIKISNDWYIWKINEPTVNIGKLEEKYQQADIGIVFPPERIINKLRTGSYNIVYPNFK